MSTKLSSVLLVIAAILLIMTINVILCKRNKFDINGYIVYCPCMGRFGNQADHFLGALGFAKALNRTLVVPAWVEYRSGEVHSVQVPFNVYFNTTVLKACYKVILMEKFMAEMAPFIWPPSERIVLCYSARGNSDSCNAKEGNPFGPFWNTYSIDFVGSEFYSPLHYDIYHSEMKIEWRKKYPAASWPVLAFTGAPASFPVQPENKELQRCIVWNDVMIDRAKAYPRHVFKVPGAYIGIHLRNGVDWVRACKFVSTTPNLFAAPQCLGYKNERGNATVEMCLPKFDLIIRQLKRKIRKDPNIKSVFVASDNNHMIPELTTALARLGINVYRQEGTPLAQLDLVILGRANYFIGNCISSFSAFVAREREVNGFPTSFWGFPPDKPSRRDEL